MTPEEEQKLAEELRQLEQGILTTLENSGRGALAPKVVANPEAQTTQPEKTKPECPDELPQWAGRRADSQRWSDLRNEIARDFSSFARGRGHRW